VVQPPRVVDSPPPTVPKKYKPEQIVTLLRQIEVEIANGKTTPQACRDGQITAQTIYR